MSIHQHRSMSGIVVHAQILESRLLHSFFLNDVGTTQLQRDTEMIRFLRPMLPIPLVNMLLCRCRMQPLHGELRSRRIDRKLDRVCFLPLRPQIERAARRVGIFERTSRASRSATAFAQ